MTGRSLAMPAAKRDDALYCPETRTLKSETG
jgi:hypothetical protein